MGTSNFKTEENKTMNQANSGAPSHLVIPNMSVELCLVCGDRASGRHYGAISCEGCKGFFKRSIRKQLGYQCRGTMNCEVTKHHRNRCQFCRLQKCLASGMRSDSVQHERKPIVDKKDSSLTPSVGSSTPITLVIPKGNAIKSTSPVYQQRSKQGLFNHNVNTNASSNQLLLKNNMATSVFPIGFNLAELTQTLMLASQQQQQHQQQLSSQCATNKPHCYSPDLSKSNGDDDDALDNNRGLCLKDLPSASNNNSQNLNFNIEPLSNPATTVGFIQTSLEKQAIDKALQLLTPIQQQIKHITLGLGAAVSPDGGAFHIKNEMLDDNEQGIDDCAELMGKGIVKNSNQKDLIIDESIFKTELVTAMQATFNLQTPALVSSYLNVHYVCETGSRVIFLSVYWFKKIPAFQLLDERTQIKLIRKSWSGLLAIALAQIGNISITTVFSTFINNIRQLADNENIDSAKIRKLSEHTTILHSFVQEMHSLDVNDMEYALLRLIVVFNPLVLVNSDNQLIRGYVHRIQSYALSSLRQTIATDQSLELSAADSEERFNTLIINLMSLNALQSDIIEDLFFTNLVGTVQIDNMIPYILTLSTNCT